MRARLLIVLLAALYAGAHGTDTSLAAPSHAATLSASATVRGITLTVDIPNRTFMRGSTVKVTASLVNTTSTLVLIDIACNEDNPWVEVMGARGKVLFPKHAPRFPTPASRCQQPNPPFPLLQGKSVRGPHSVQLRGNRVRAAVMLVVGGKDVLIRTPTVKIRLK